MFQPDFSRYGSAYYQFQFTQALSQVHEVFQYGPMLEGYNRGDSISDVLDKCPFTPDLICFAAGWEIEDPTILEFDPHPAISTSDVSIPSVMILNKEYKKLESKFQFIHDKAVRLVFTVHHACRKWEEQVGVPFIHFPFAVSSELFIDYHEPKRYALGFSGSLHEQWTDVRKRIKDRLFWSTL